MQKQHWHIVGVWGVTAAFTGCSDDGAGGSTGSGTVASDSLATTQQATDDPPTTDTPTTAATTAVATTGEPTGTTTGTTAGTTTGPVATDTGSSTSGSDTGVLPCGGCPPNFICKYDQCLPDLGPCATYDDCPGDSYCDEDGICIPCLAPPGLRCACCR